MFKYFYWGMRTIYAKILSWFLLTLVVCLVGFVGTSIYLGRAFPGPGSPMARNLDFILAQASKILHNQGREALGAYLAEYNATMHSKHVLVDSAGQDAVSGEDCRALLKDAATLSGRPSGPFRMRPPGALVTAPRDGYRLLFTMSAPTGQFSDILPYYLWILGAILLLTYLMASRFIKPLQKLVSTVERFGRGDLAVRLGWKRRDEFGELGTAFDKMAERIDTLLTAERRLLQDVSHELRSPLAPLDTLWRSLVSSISPLSFTVPVNLKRVSLISLPRCSRVTTTNSIPSAATLPSTIW